MALITTTPDVPFSEIVLPFILAGPDSTLSVTGNPEVALALMEKGTAVVNLSGIGKKLIVCSLSEGIIEKLIKAVASGLSNGRWLLSANCIFNVCSPSVKLSKA